MFEKYGGVLKTTDMGRSTYYTNDPAIAAICLSESPFWTKKITSDHPLFGVRDLEAGIFLGDTETEAWQVAHKFMPPAFSPKAIRHYTPIFQETVQSAFQVFDELDESGEAWNVYQYMLKLGSQAVGRIVLQMDMGHFSSVNAPIHKIVAVIAETLTLNKKVTSKGDWYARLPFGDPKRLKDSRKEMATLILDAINKCPPGGTEDLPLQDAALSASSVVDYAKRAVDPKGNKISPERLLHVLPVVTGAGFTTTSSLLSWIIYSLVTYEGMQDRLLQELVDHGITGDTKLTFELTNSLPFLDKFEKEVQRLHNPSFQPGRTAKVDCILPGGFKIPADSVMIVALHHIHNNPSLWDDPHKFNPDRWDTERVKSRNKYSYIPFAAGPRGCIGFNFALQEVKVLIPELVYRYQFEKSGEEPTDVIFPTSIPPFPSTFRILTTVAV